MKKLTWLPLTILAACAVQPEGAPSSPAATPPPLQLPEGPYVTKGELPAATYLWTERTDVFIPRAVPGLVDQPNRKRLLVYGGWQENGVRGDTWEWDGHGWIRREPLHDAGRRAAPAMVYDDARDRVLLYGGAALFFPTPQLTSDRRTWEWDGHDWSSVATATSPAPTMASAHAWDPTSRRMFLFGGFANVVTSTQGGVEGASSSGTDELWAYDGTDWKQFPKTEPWPEPRGLSSMVWDRTRNRLVMHSGQTQVRFAENRLTFGDGSGGATFVEALGDTWEFDGATWTQIATPKLPQAGTESLFWDPLANELRMVLDELTGTRVAPTLRRYTGSSWDLVSRSEDKTTNRVVTSSTYSSANQQALVFAGVLLAASGLPNSDISLIEELAGEPFVTLPPASQLAAVDRASLVAERDGSLLLFGGLSNASPLDSTFRWNGGKWIRLAPPASPPARWAASMARSGDEVVLFGGYGEGGTPLADTWTWNGTTWSAATGETAPPARAEAAMFSLADAAYLFGGDGGGGALGDTWQYRAGAWSQLSPTNAPSARERLCAASLPTRGLVAGGQNDVWAFDGADWALLGPTRFGLRAGCAAAFVPETSQALLVGGSGAEATQDLSEVFPRIQSLDDTTENARVDRPVRRHSAVFSANPVSGGAILAGGIRGDNGQPLADTWQLQLLGQACSDDAGCGTGSFCTEGVCCEQSSCGPCGTCANPVRPGLCSPRPAGPAAGCDGAYACNAEGHCRVGPGGPCADETACAAGACIKSADAGTGTCCGLEGCTVQCLEGGQLRNPDGTTSSCAPYGCEGNACKSRCSSIADCSPGSICTSDNVCVAQVESGSGGGEGSCGCKVAGQPAHGALCALGLLVLGVVGRRRRAVARQ